jgi:hypothetical protein
MDIDLATIETKGMTPDEKADICFRLVGLLKRSVGETTQWYMRTGELLEFFANSKLYKHYSSDCNTWEDFVRHTCSFGVSEADHIRRVYCKFGKLIGDRQISFGRLLRMIPVVNDENVEELLEVAEHAPPQGFRDVVRKLKGEKVSDECEHLNTEPFARCKDCGAWVKL